MNIGREHYEWTGSRCVPIHEFFNNELEQSIDRIKSLIAQVKAKNDGIHSVGIPSLNGLLARLMAERAKRIGKKDLLP